MNGVIVLIAFGSICCTFAGLAAWQNRRRTYVALMGLGGFVQLLAALQLFAAHQVPA